MLFPLRCNIDCNHRELLPQCVADYFQGRLPVKVEFDSKNTKAHEMLYTHTYKGYVRKHRTYAQYLEPLTKEKTVKVQI